MDLRSFSEFLADWEFRGECDPVRTAGYVVRLTHMFVKSHPEWEKATPADFLHFADMIAAAVDKRNSKQKLTVLEHNSLAAWDAAETATLKDHWDTIPPFKRIQFDDGRISLACQLLTRVQRFGSARESERGHLMLSIGLLAARLTNLQERIVEDVTRTVSPAMPRPRKMRGRLKPISRQAALPRKREESSPSTDSTAAPLDPIANKPVECVAEAPSAPPAPKLRQREMHHAYTRRIPEKELRSLLAKPEEGKNPLLTAASHFGVSTKTIRRRAEEYGIKI